MRAEKYKNFLLANFFIAMTPFSACTAKTYITQKDNTIAKEVIMGKSRVTVEITAMEENHRLIIIITAKNHSTADILVEPYFFEDDPMAPIFAITDKSGNRVDYVGRFAKRAAPAIEDYIRIAPGKSKAQVMDITKNYAFPEKRQTYTIAYKATDVDKITNLVGHRESNIVAISFSPQIGK